MIWRWPFSTSSRCRPISAWSCCRWRSLPPSVQFTVAFRSKFDDPYPGKSPLPIVVTIQIQQPDQPLGFGGQAGDRSVGMHLDLFGGQNLRGIRRPLIGFGAVAGSASVQQIVVVFALLGLIGLWYEMVEIEHPLRASPLLARQAVDTPKGELIAKPRPVGATSGVSQRSVLAAVWLIGIGERGGHKRWSMCG